MAQLFSRNVVSRLAFDRQHSFPEFGNVLIDARILSPTFKPNE
jgi:hypothetical protein